MQGDVLVGRGPALLRQPADALIRKLEEATGAPSPRLSFMSPEHHRVRDTVVRELPRAGTPLTVQAIASGTDLPAGRVESILGELESRLFFLVRDREFRVSWAYPVTTDRTPHRLVFSSGETIYAA